MKVLQKYSFFNVLGKGWYGQDITTTYNLNAYEIHQIENLKNPKCRDEIEVWLNKRAGDFQIVTDFYCSIELSNDETLEHEWSNQDNEFKYHDITWGDC